MALPYGLTRMEVLRVAAPLVAVAFAWLFYTRLRRPARGPTADWWEVLRRTLLPPVDRLLKHHELGYAAYTLPQKEYVGTLALEPEEAEGVLWAHGFVRNPLAAMKRHPINGEYEAGSWVYRKHPLAVEQVHVILFDVEGGTSVYAHKEPNAANPFTALQHYLGGGRKHAAERGAEFVIGRLPLKHWSKLADRLPSVDQLKADTADK